MEEALPSGQVLGSLPKSLPPEALGFTCKWGCGGGGQCIQHLHSRIPTAAGACGDLQPFSLLKGRRNWLMN